MEYLLIHHQFFMYVLPNVLIGAIWFGFAAYILWRYRGQERAAYFDKYGIWILLLGMTSLAALKKRGFPSLGMYHDVKILGGLVVIVFLWLFWLRPKRSRTKTLVSSTSTSHKTG
jgi:hypothetical protein